MFPVDQPEVMIGNAGEAFNAQARVVVNYGIPSADIDQSWLSEIGWPETKYRRKALIEMAHIEHEPGMVGSVV